MLVCVGKGKAVLGGGQIFADFLPEVVATTEEDCDKTLMRRQNRVAKHHVLVDRGDWSLIFKKNQRPVPPIVVVEVT